MDNLPPNQRPHWKRNNIIGIIVSSVVLLLSLLSSSQSAVFLTVAALIAIILFTVRLLHKEKSVVVTNTEYNGHKTGINKDTGEITLCSLGYPAGKAGKVLVLSQGVNSITVIDHKKTTLIPFSNISSIEITHLSNGGAIIYYENVIASRAGMMDRNERLRTILAGFEAKDADVAQMIVEVVGSKCNLSILKG